MIALASKKSEAWDIIGCNFWSMGHQHLKTDKVLMQKLVASVEHGQQSCVLGASAVDLILALIEKKSRVSVIDFSRTMCDDLIHTLGNYVQYEIILHDVLNPVPKRLKNQFDFIFSDQLINCLSKKDLFGFFRNVKSMLAPHGEFHTLIRVGLYDFDKLLIQQGLKNNTIKQFWNEDEHIIDFSKAQHEIESLLKQHTEQNTRLISWYVGRGKEVRFQKDDITETLINRHINSGKLTIVEKSLYSHDNNILYLKIKNSG